MLELIRAARREAVRRLDHCADSEANEEAAQQVAPCCVPAPAPATAVAATLSGSGGGAPSAATVAFCSLSRAAASELGGDGAPHVLTADDAVQEAKRIVRTRLWQHRVCVAQHCARYLNPVAASFWTAASESPVGRTLSGA